MRHFYIDYENVQSSSPLCGVEGLNSDDEVFIFYSNAARTINKYYWNKFVGSPCKKRFYKLEKPSKNALDFCIAVQLGTIFAEKGRREAAIISNDNGYQAAIDYCYRCFGKNSIRIVKASCISEAIDLLGMPESELNDAIKSLSTKIDMVGEIKTISERTKKETLDERKPLLIRLTSRLASII